MAYEIRIEDRKLTIKKCDELIDKEIYDQEEKYFQVLVFESDIDENFNILKEYFKEKQVFKIQKTAFKGLLNSCFKMKEAKEEIFKSYFQNILSFYLNNYDFSYQIIFLINLKQNQTSTLYINFILKAMQESSFSFTDIKTQHENSINPKIHLLNIFSIIFNKCYFTQKYGEELLTCLNDHNKYFDQINNIISNPSNNFKKIQEEKQIILYLYLFIDNFFDSQQKEKIKLINSIQKNVLASKSNEIQPFYKLIKEKNDSIENYFELIYTNKKKLPLLFELDNETEIDFILNCLGQTNDKLKKIELQDKVDLIFIIPDKNHTGSYYYIKNQFEISPYNGFIIFKVDKKLATLIKIFTWKQKKFNYDIEFALKEFGKENVNYSQIGNSPSLNNITKFHTKNEFDKVSFKSRKDIDSNTSLYKIIKKATNDSINECYNFFNTINIFNFIKENPNVEKSFEKDIIDKKLFRINDSLPNYGDVSYLHLIKEKQSKSKPIYESFINNIKKGKASPEKEFIQSVKSISKNIPSFVNDIELKIEDIMKFVTNNPNIQSPYILGLFEYIDQYQYQPLQFQNNQEKIGFYLSFEKYIQNILTINMFTNLSKALSISSTKINLDNNNNDSNEISFNKGFNLYLNNTLRDYLKPEHLSSLSQIKEITYIVESISKKMMISHPKQYHLLLIYAYVSNVNDINDPQVKELIPKALTLEDDLYENLHTYGIDVSKDNENDIQLNNEMLDKCTNKFEYLGELFYVFMEQYKDYDTRLKLLQIIFSKIFENVYYFKKAISLFAKDIFTLDVLTDKTKESVFTDDKDLTKLNEIILQNNQMKYKILFIQGIEVNIQDFFYSPNFDWKKFDSDEMLKHLEKAIDYLYSFTSFSNENTIQILFYIAFLKIYFSLYLQQTTNEKTVSNCFKIQDLLSDKTSDEETKSQWIIVLLYIFKLLRHSLLSYNEFRIFNFVNAQMLWTSNFQFGRELYKYEFPFLSNLEQNEEYDTTYNDVLEKFNFLRQETFRNSKFDEDMIGLLQSVNMDLYVDIAFNLILPNLVEEDYYSKMEYIEFGSWNRFLLNKAFIEENEMKKYFLFMFTDQLNKIFIKNEQKTEFKNLIEIEMNLITYKIVLGFLYAKNNSENILSIVANSSIKQSQNDLNSLIKYFLLTGIKNYVNKEPTKLINVYYDIIKKLHLMGINNEKLYFNIVYVLLKEYNLKEEDKQISTLEDIEELLSNIIDRSIKQYNSNLTKYINYIYAKINYKEEICRNWVVEQKSAKLYKDIKVLEGKSKGSQTNILEEFYKNKCFAHYKINSKTLLLMELMYLKIYPSFDEFQKEFMQNNNNKKLYPLINYFIENNLRYNAQPIKYNEIKGLIDLYKESDTGIIKSNNENMICLLNENVEINLNDYLFNNLEGLIIAHGNSMSLKEKTPNLCCGDLVEYDFYKIEMELSKMFLPLITSKSEN